ncbi:MAG: hypothetical protein PHH09_06390 [Methanoregulaceae archaeon]|nr:hypothetical protein [Methanoregulaceae archaeon]MDD5048542.1 hypothetical protein [Methanoregulaceae archaeon]MDD5685660.1 hypothetical protein [Methanoregulaceae archaeon]
MRQIRICCTHNSDEESVETVCEEREGAGDAMREKRARMTARMSTIH